MSTEAEQFQYDAAFQGNRGAFSEVASWELLSPEARLLPCPRLEEVFDAVNKGTARYGVIPIENTLAGTILLSVDLLNANELSIIGETVCHIAHAVVGAAGTTLGGIRRILSHPVALAQCERFFRAHPEIQPVPEFDTAGVVEKVIRENLTDSAAIAGRRNAELYGGVVLEDNIQDHAENYTRFLLISSNAVVSSVPGRFKTTIVFKLGNTPGALVRSLRPFADRRIDLTKIESRPIKGAPFEYFFYIDLVADSSSVASIREAIAEVAAASASLRILGTYPAKGN